MAYMSYSLNSLKGGYIGDYIGTTMRAIKGNTRSLDYSSYRHIVNDNGKEHASYYIGFRV